MEAVLMIEDILADLYKSDPEWRIARLYINPAARIIRAA